MAERFLQQNPEVTIGYEILERIIVAGGSQFEAERRIRTLKLIDDFILARPDNPMGRAMLVRAFVRDGQTDTAFTEYSRIYKLTGKVDTELLMEIVRGVVKHDTGGLADAAEVCQNIGDKDAIPYLIDILNRINASQQSASSPRSPFSFLSQYSDYSSMSVARALGVLGDKRAIPVLTRSLQTPRDGLLRLYAADALGKLGDMRGVPILIKALNAANEKHSTFAVEALGELKDKRAVPELDKILVDSEGRQRVRIALALARLGEDNAVTLLIEMFNDSNNKAQRDVAEALAELKDERAASALLHALQNDENPSLTPRARISVAKLLGEIGDKRAMPHLIEILDLENRDTRIC